MGLTNSSTGKHILKQNIANIENNSDYTIMLCGNPNVGKSSVFNLLTRNASAHR